MKKTLALAGALCVCLGSTQLSAQASDWFDKYDRDHDKHWTYDEFKDAHHNWWLKHKREKELNDAELRGQFDKWDHERNGWVTREHVKTWHHW